MMDERISLISSSGMAEQLISPESTVTVPPSRLTLQPSRSRIATAISTSVILGQLCITLIPFTAAHAARIGRELFFEPCSRVFPSSLMPPLIMRFSIFTRSSKALIHTIPRGAYA